MSIFTPSLKFKNIRLPAILQVEKAECGIACLAMVASYYGKQIDLAALRCDFPISTKGTNLAQLIRYADHLNLTARAIRLELCEIPQLKAPCILHWDFNHFVVLKSATQKCMVIHDPAFGVRQLSYAEADKHFTGVALELEPTADFRPANSRQRISLISLFGKVKGLWKSFSLIFVMACATEAFALVSPMFNQWVVDEAMTSADRNLLNVLVIGFALMLVFQTAISLARGWTVMYLSTHLNHQWMANVFTHLLRLRVAWFEKRHLGDIVSRFGSIKAIQRTLTGSFIETILDGLLAVATLSIMLLYSAKLATVALTTLGLYLILRLVSYRPLVRANEENLVLSAKEQSCFLESVRAVQAIKLFGRESERRSQWLNLLTDSVNRNVRTQKFSLGFRIANTALFGIENLIVFWLGAHMVMDGYITVGMLMAYASYQGQFITRFSSLIDKAIEFHMLSLHGERLADIVLEPVEDDPVTRTETGNLEPKIELVNVSFRYADGEPWILRHLHLTITPGESMAITGPSGCGKTTLIKIILGILSPTEGEIRCGGIPVNRLGHRAYRSCIAAVMQDDQLLSGSLADNISFFDPQPDRKRIEECAKLAAIHADIAAMPMGYHTFIGDMGAGLSGGQKQRALLARALYKAPKVLVLDEATSHLDVNLEHAVNEAVRALEISRICVAHRPETIAMAEHVVRLEKGCIVLEASQPSTMDRLAHA